MLFLLQHYPPPAPNPAVTWRRLAFPEGIAAPTSAVDDVAEKFGRPRARSLSLSRHDLSLPSWAEDDDEDAEGGAAAAALPSSEPPRPRLKDRRRTVSMSVAEEYRGSSRPSSQVCKTRLKLGTVYMHRRARAAT